MFVVIYVYTSQEVACTANVLMQSCDSVFSALVAKYFRKMYLLSNSSEIFPVYNKAWDVRTLVLVLVILTWYHLDFEFLPELLVTKMNLTCGSPQA